jgi:predicted ATPase
VTTETRHHAIPWRTAQAAASARLPAPILRYALIAGEPGIGKTLLVEQVRSHARAQGVVELAGLCGEDEGAPPYWPWIEAFRPYIVETDPSVLRQQVGAIRRHEKLTP